MTQWSGNKVNASQVNDGNEYERKDKPTRQQLNAMFNNSLYASNIAENVANQLASLDPNEKIEFKGLNPNLLINGDFRVNQRGKTEYNTARTYFVDRWFMQESDLVFNVATKTLSNIGEGTKYIYQKLEDTSSLLGKILTISAKINNVVYSRTITMPETLPTANALIGSSFNFNKGTCYLYFYNSPKVFGLVISLNQGQSIIIDYAKLEVGSIATANSPRPYAEEIPMCMRYYQIRSNTYTIQPNSIDRPIPMRVNGTIGTTTINGVTYNTVDAEIY